jgi:hypothetical protein
MTLLQAIKIIEGVSGKTVTSIKFNLSHTQIIYQLNHGEDQFLEL